MMRKLMIVSLLMVVSLANAGVGDRDENGWTDLHWAVLAGDVEAARKLIASGADINAASKGDESDFSEAGKQRAKSLGYDFSNWGNYREPVLQIASIYANQAIVKLLLAAGADVNGGNTALIAATLNGHTETAKLLLAAGADVHAKNNDGDTALHWAAWKGQTETAKLLLAAGADVHAKNNDGWTDLHWAAWKGQTETAKLLLAAGADVHAKNNDGDTALDWAKEYERDDTIKVLRNWKDYATFERRAALEREKIPMQEELGHLRAELPKELRRLATPPLVAAGKAGDHSKVRKLLSDGANIGESDIFGNTIFDYAKQKRDTNLMHVLLDYQQNQSKNSKLPANVQADLNFVKIKKLISEEDYFGATVAFERILRLSEQHGFELPEGFYFKYAQVLQLDEQNDKAVEAVIQYLQATAQSGEHYLEALQILESAQ